MPAVTEPGKIRNIAVAGHRGVGKTSLVEALLFQAGKTNRLGHDRAGHDRRRLGRRRAQARRCRSPARCSIVDWQDRKINLVDCPGDAGFQADTLRGAPRRRRRARRRQRGHGRRGQHDARLEARRRVRALARRLREHARPRARRLLPRARGRARAALRPLRRDPAADRRRARGRRASSTCCTCARTLDPSGGKEGGPQPIPDDDGRRRCRSTARSCSTRSSRRTRT